MLIMNCCLSVVIFAIFACCEGQQVSLTTTMATPLNLTIPKMPNCCEFPNQQYFHGSCLNLTTEPSYISYYYNSNATHIDTNPITFNLTFYHNKLECPEKAYRIDESEIVGFIFNSSFIFHETEGTTILYNSANYCVSANNDQMFIVICNTPISMGQFYFPCLIVSTFCYIFSSVIYTFILDVKDVYKKCFIGYSTCMAVTFLFLVLLQKINTGCEILGSIFFIFILSSFVWLCCLCIDMVCMVNSVMDNEKPERFYLYVALSIVIPCIMLFISMITSGSPDIPSAFLKRQEMCKFENARIAVMFVPMGFLLLLAIGSLVYTFYLIREKDKIHKVEIKWLEKKNNLKYITRSCLMIWIPSFIWVLDAMMENVTVLYGTMMVYEIIEGLQGIFVVAVFVLNRYTRKELYNTLFVKKTVCTDYSNSKRFERIMILFRNDSTISGSQESHNLGQT